MNDRNEEITEDPTVARGRVHDAEYDWADHLVDYERLRSLAEKAHLLENGE